MVCHPDAHPQDLNFDSYIENKDAALLPAAAVHNFVGFYNPPPNDNRFSSLLTEDLTGLPPSYIQVSGADPLRDDGIHYARKLENARYGYIAHFLPCAGLSSVEPA
jgi:acetyl esterase/lipase